MARHKKDGRYINYYIERRIYERLKVYADEKGQPMTTAIERIIESFLDNSVAPSAGDAAEDKVAHDTEV